MCIRDSSWTTRRTRGGDFYLATTGDLYLAISGDFSMATDTTRKLVSVQQIGMPDQALIWHQSLTLCDRLRPSSKEVGRPRLLRPHRILGGFRPVSKTCLRQETHCATNDPVARGTRSRCRRRPGRPPPAREILWPHLRVPERPARRIDPRTGSHNDRWL